MAENDALKEAQEQYREQKARASDLSRDLDLSRREIKTWQDKAAVVDGLEEEIAALKADLAEANRLLGAATKSAQDSAVNTSQDAKRAAAFLAIRAALETK